MLPSRGAGEGGGTTNYQLWSENRRMSWAVRIRWRPCPGSAKLLCLSFTDPVPECSGRMHASSACLTARCIAASSRARLAAARHTGGGAPATRACGSLALNRRSIQGFTQAFPRRLRHRRPPRRRPAAPPRKALGAVRRPQTSRHCPWRRRRRPPPPRRGRPAARPRHPAACGQPLGKTLVKP